MSFHFKAQWGRPLAPGESESLMKWCEEFSTLGSTEPDALVIEAIKRAMDQNVRKLAYVNKILQEWFDNGITSIEHITALAAEWKAQKDKGKGPDKGPNVENNKYEKFYL